MDLNSPPVDTNSNDRISNSTNNLDIITSGSYNDGVQIPQKSIKPEKQIVANNNVGYSSIEITDLEQFCILKLLFCEKKFEYVKKCSIEQTRTIEANYFLDALKLTFIFPSEIDLDGNIGEITQEEILKHAKKIESDFGFPYVVMELLNTSKIRLAEKLLKFAESFTLSTIGFPFVIDINEALTKLIIIQHIHQVYCNIFTLQDTTTPDMTLPVSETTKITEARSCLDEQSPFFNFTSQLIRLHYYTKKLFLAVQEIQETGRWNQMTGWETVDEELDILIDSVCSKCNEGKFGSNFTLHDNNPHDLSNKNKLKGKIMYEILPEKYKAALKSKFERHRSTVSKYLMPCKKPGLHVCFNNIHYQSNLTSRIGTEYDEISLVYLYEQLGFYTERHEDVTFQYLRNHLEKLSKHSVLEEVNCLIITLMGHGDIGSSGTFYITIDNKHVPISEIVSQFNDQGCPALRGKPKIFFYIGCRGDNLAFSYDHDFESSKSEYSSKVSMDSNKYNYRILARGKKSDDFRDVLIVYATLPGFVSFRRDGKVKYVEILCDVFREFAYEFHVEEMLKIVHERMSKITFNYPVHQATLQIPCFENYCFKNCYFKVFNEISTD